MTQVQRAPVGRVGIISALGWVALALGIWFLSSRLGIQLSSIEPLMYVAGPAVFAVIGRLHRLNHPVDWVAAGAVTFVLALILGIFSACVVTMAVVG